ncbi:hypothetical protein FVR03_01870 [Pontibacter qinzhouensis]|uniref:STAS/SEC14 domain-containing protein n=1 Tax=Pontibacter qinzhouensis TaxID=2603253 RepID=A0A5C8KD27_9BACT|nr:hypothetical protein [Pontibacter qinzhouensis]TXK52192.1 hypothetical protein FVR03_01870 [Pontibacter qinzhouensis]
MTISSTPAADLVYLPDTEVLMLRWKEKPDTTSFKKEYMMAFQFVAKYPHIRYYCTDLTKSGAFERDQELWLTTYFYDTVNKLLHADVFAAVVFSEKHFNAIVHNYMLQAANAKHNFIHFNYFTLLPEALHWLRSIKKDQDMIIS